MPYKVVAKDGILDLAKGKSWRAGQSIGEGELPPERIKAMLAEGVIREWAGAVEPAEALKVVVDAETLAVEVEGAPAPVVEQPVLRPVTEVDGVGPARAADLGRLGITTVASLAQARVATLLGLPRVNEKTAEELIAAAQDLLDEEVEAALDPGEPEVDDA